MKKLALSAFALLCAAGTAYAEPVALPTDQPVYLKFLNLEQVDPSGLNSIDVPGPYGMAGNWGVFLVSTIEVGFVPVGDEHLEIEGGANAPFFVNGGSAGNQVYGVFYDIQLLDNQNATGGVLDLYWGDAGGPAGVSLATANPDLATVTAFTTGTFLARINFASGIEPNPLVTIHSTVDITAGGATGFAHSYANVDTTVVGAWTAALNGDWFNTLFGTRDIRFSNSFGPQANWTENGYLGLNSDDPARAFTAANIVPEPATLGLLGVGLLGLVARARRRKAA